MTRKYLLMIMTAIFLCANISPVFAAGTAVLLSDEELDQIYAQGFNFADFNDFMANLDSIFTSPSLTVNLNDRGTGTVSFGGEAGVQQQIFATETGDINYINLQDYAQQFANSLVNVNAAGSTVLVGLNLTVVIDSIISGDVNSFNFLSGSR